MMIMTREQIEAWRKAGIAIPDPATSPRNDVRDVQKKTYSRDWPKRDE
jgi:hypothetical protein